MGKHGFDLVTHKRNRKGVITSINPYTLRIRGTKWEFERPPGSGNIYAANGELIAGPIKDEEAGVKKEAQEETKKLEKLMSEVKEEVSPKVEPMPVVARKEEIQVMPKVLEKGK